MNSVTPQSNLMGLVLLQLVQIGQSVPSQAQCPAHGYRALVGPTQPLVQQPIMIQAWHFPV